MNMNNIYKTEIDFNKIEEEVKEKYNKLDYINIDDDITDKPIASFNINDLDNFNELDALPSLWNDTSIDDTWVNDSYDNELSFNHDMKSILSSLDKDKTNKQHKKINYEISKKKYDKDEDEDEDENEDDDEEYGYLSKSEQKTILDRLLLIENRVNKIYKLLNTLILNQKGVNEKILNEMFYFKCIFANDTNKLNK